MKRFTIAQQSLQYHAQLPAGKIELRPTKPCRTQYDLALAYTPGVAEPVRRIAQNSANSYRYTNRGNAVAVITNGTAVLGLGNMGALASKPVMEGKSVLFKRFAGIDAYDLEVAETDPDELIKTIARLEPTFGGINLEDIAAPECFYIETELQKRLTIPVFHDDQHGTAIIAGAALLNALELVGKKISQIKIVINGAGAAGIRCAEYVLLLGAQRKNILMCDSQGLITTDRKKLHSSKKPFAVKRSKFVGTTLEWSLHDADVFIGVSVANVLTPAMVKSMTNHPIIFALANPDPEMKYAVAQRARPDSILATGRSDYPNQINNVLGFPFIFRGALDVRARLITPNMKLAATVALAKLAHQPVVPAVLKAYGLRRLQFGSSYLIPKPFDSRALVEVSCAVAQAAINDGVAQVKVTATRYRRVLQKLANHIQML